MTTWQVLKQEGRHKTQPATVEMVWVPKGEIESVYDYYLGSDNAVADDIGRLYGPGEYLFLNHEDKRLERKTIGSRQEYFVRDPDEIPVPAPSAATVMERDA